MSYANAAEFKQAIKELMKEMSIEVKSMKSCSNKRCYAFDMTTKDGRSYLFCFNLVNRLYSVAPSGSVGFLRPSLVEAWERGQQ